MRRAGMREDRTANVGNRPALLLLPFPGRRTIVHEKLRAGQLAPDSGHYEVVARDGEHMGIYRRGLKGRPLPPTPAKDQGYIYAGARVRRIGQ